MSVCVAPSRTVQSLHPLILIEDEASSVDVLALTIRLHADLATSHPVPSQPLY